MFLEHAVGEKFNASWRRDLESQIPMQAKQIFFSLVFRKRDN